MNIYPQDLGEKNCERVRRHRAAFAPGVAEWAAPSKASPRWRFRAVFMGLLYLFVLFLVMGLNIRPVFLFFAFIVFAIVFSKRRPLHSSSFLAHRNMQDGRECVSLPEVLRLREASDDPLQGKYLDLVQTVLLLAPSEAAVAQTVRAAIRALGTAIEGLPRHASSLLTDNPGALRAEADRLATLARTEPDAVIAASLERRADSYAHRAETVVRAQTLLRRNDALRDEMADQADALRTSLIASGITQEIEDAGLADLATNVQRIATEVNALSAARAEVEDALHGGPRRAEDQATRVRLRKYLDETQAPVNKNVTQPGG